ncbi:MAG TPA: histidine phosphatase family protein [Ktedonobacterales bacterium]
MRADAAEDQPADDIEGSELFGGPKRTLYVVRHGKYESISRPPDDPDGPLTEMGAQQAALTAERLRGQPISAIHCSTLQRARETAEIIARRFPGVVARPSPLLCECIPSVPALIKDYLERQVPAAELAAGPAQARAAWATYFQPPEDDADDAQIIVSSGNLISYLVARALGAPDDAWIQADIQHGGLTEIIVSQRRGAILMRHNDTGHLPPALRTFV